MKHDIEFVSYDGEYPCLCMGTLVIKIDGKQYAFGMQDNIFTKTNIKDEYKYPIFWASSGGIAHSEDYSDMLAIGGNWVLDTYLSSDKEEEEFLEDYPEEIRDIEIFEEMIRLMNKNIEEIPCCGGCI